MRGIIFSGPMVRAILDGRKTQTRRILKVQPPEDFTKVEYVKNDSEVWFSPEYYLKVPELFVSKIPYRAGSELYIKEGYYQCDPLFFDNDDVHNCTMPNGHTCYVGYDSSMDSESVRCANEYGVKKKSPLFMPQWASRLHVKIIAARAEKLQDITPEDCSEEGCLEREEMICGIATDFYSMDGTGWKAKRVLAYAAYIDKLNGVGTWESNPWVFVYDYEVIWKK